MGGFIKNFDIDEVHFFEGGSSKVEFGFVDSGIVFHFRGYDDIG